MDQSADTNRTGMDNLSLSAITIGSKEIAVGSARLGKNIIEGSSQASASVERRGHRDQDFPFGSRESGNKMGADFGRNADETLVMNPLRTIRSP